MAIRFLHTADWQLGMNAAHTGRASSRVREARFRTAERLAELAREEKVDFAVLAGDTFENHAVSAADVERAAGILGSFPCPVYVLPGNHDPLAPGAVWNRPVWEAARNVHILGEARPVEAGEAVLLPCPLRSRWSKEDPTAWIPAGLYADRIRVGIAHGAIETIPDAQHPIPAGAATARRLDYLALGDWHSLLRLEDSQQVCRTAYSGTPEPTAFGERDSGQALIVEIDEPRAAPRLRAVQTAALQWRQWKAEILHQGDLTRLQEGLASAQGPNVLADLQLTGTLFPEEISTLESIRAMEPQFLFLRVDDTGLVPTLELSAESIRDPIVREALGRLEAKAQAGQEAAAARLAIRSLLRVAKGVGA
jgi:hypothetical protein